MAKYEIKNGIAIIPEGVWLWRLWVILWFYIIHSTNGSNSDMATPVRPSRAYSETYRGA